MTEPMDARDALRARYASKGALVTGADFDTEAQAIPFAVSLEGLEGTGKTSFVVKSAPTPIVLINFGDRSAIPFLYDMSEERRKLVTLYDIQPSNPEGWTLGEATASLRSLTEIIQAEGPHMRGGTFGLDGGSSWWSVMQQVFVEPKEQARAAEGKKQVGGIIYEEANARVRGVLGYLKTLGCYLMITHQLKQDWAADGPIPNQYSARRNSQVPYIVDCVVRMAKVCLACGAPNCQKPDHIGRKHRARLEKLSGNTALEGMWVDDLDFAKLYEFQTGKKFPGEIVP